MEQIPKDSCFNKFQEIMIESLLKALGNDYKVTPTSILKNNSKQLEGIIIAKGDNKIAPTIYLNDYYNQYIYGRDMFDIVHEVIHEYKESMLKLQINKEEFDYDMDYLKNRIVYRIVSMKHNKILLDTMPHVPYLDLALTFHCLVQCNENDMGTIRITYEVLKYFNVTIEELKEIACKNTMRLLGASLRPMKQVIDILLNNEEKVDKKSSFDLEEKEYFNIELDKYNRNDMYVLTNSKGVNGASCILYPNLLKEIATKLDSDLYILPSSIHEVIIIAKEQGYKKEELEYMVKEINESEVPIEDILSDRVYIYSRTLDGIHM